MKNSAQVSATISIGTKEKLDRFTEEHGLKKNYVVEQALLYFIEARRTLPDEAFIPTQIILDDQSFDELLKAADEPAAPTDALVELMNG